MFRPTGSDGDAFAKFPQHFQLPTRWGGHVTPKSGACARFPPDESRSPARPRRASVRRQSLCVARSHLFCWPTFSLISFGIAAGTLLLNALPMRWLQVKAGSAWPALQKARCESCSGRSGNVSSIPLPVASRWSVPGRQPVLPGRRPPKILQSLSQSLKSGQLWPEWVL